MAQKQRTAKRPVAKAVPVAEEGSDGLLWLALVAGLLLILGGQLTH